MSAIQQLITEHMDIWTAADTGKRSGRGRASSNAGSVYGVKILRELILELAVRGKLVPQDTNDEPASELLKRIQAEKSKLVAEGKIKKEKPLEPISEDEKPFELPKNWELVRLESITNINGGFAFKSTNYIEDGVRVIRISDFDEKGFKNDKIVRYKYSNDLEQYALAERNILMAMTGGTVGKCYLVKKLLEAMVVNQRVATIKLMPLVSPEYINCVLQTSTVQNVIQEAKNSTNDNISMLDIKEFFMPIPPLVEQHRIVAKVDELMALCDQLEAQHSNAAEAHEKLVSHLLVTLTHSQSADDFSVNWQRISAHFDTLFTTEASIDALKQTLLQLAVMGKLVPQDPNDEPASELLKRIQAEKTKLVAEGKIKKEKQLVAIADDEKPFELPQGWEWVRLGNITNFGVTEKLDVITDETWVLDLEDIEKDTSRVIQKNRFSEKQSLSDKNRFKIGDVLYGKLRPYLNKVIVADEDGVCTTEILPIRCYGPFNNKYFMYALKSPYFIDYVNARSYGMKMPRLGTDDGRNSLFPLAPIYEQHRIVTKVDELMALCDQLKTRIQQANQQQQTIANVLVAQVLN